MALKAAVEKVIVEHARQGLPIYVWRDDKVVAIPPEELRAESACSAKHHRPNELLVRKRGMWL